MLPTLQVGTDTGSKSFSVHFTLNSPVLSTRKSEENQTTDGSVLDFTIFIATTKDQWILFNNQTVHNSGFHGPSGLLTTP